MRYAFKPLPGSGSDAARPALLAELIGQGGSVPLVCLVDSGSLHNRFGHWVGEEAGVDLSGAEVERIGVGGSVIEARTVTVRLELSELTWEAPVSFCEPWPFDFQILGQLGFLRWFRVVIDAAEEMLEVIPNQA